MVRVGWLSRARRAAREVAGVALAMGLATAAHAQSPAPQATAPAATSAPQQATAASVGLLPIHAIAVDLDALPGSKPDKHGKDELAPLQQLWDSFLKGGGFNVIEFDVDVHDLGDGGAGRVARLCAWAKQNDVRIAPTLVGADDGKPLPADYPNLAASFVGKVIANLGASGLASYSQIVFYQLDKPLNHPASHGAMEAAAAATLLKAAAENVRAAEQAGLASAGLQPTPLLASGSFDYELIRRGAIAHTPITDENYTQAYGGLRDYLLAVFGSAPVEAASVQWFPGSISSEGVGRLSDLVNRLEGDLPGKLLIIDTGYSSAAGSDTSQARYYQVALNNLCDVRANQGVDSPFAGILWRSAFDVGNGESKAATEPAAGDVAKVWDDPKSDAREARSWLNSIQSHFGLLARSNDKSQGLVPKTAYRIMSGLEAALSQSPQASDALAAVKELGAASKTGGVGTAVKSRLQNALFGMLDAWLSKTADNLFTTPAEQPAAAPGAPQALPDIQIWPGAIPTSAKVGVPVVFNVTLFNAGTAPASDATVYLRDGQRNLLAQTSPMPIFPNGNSSVQVTWTPTGAGAVKGVTAEAFCSNDADPSPASNQAPMGDFSVAPGDKPPRPPRDFGALFGDRAVLVSSASMSTSPPPSSGSSPTGGTRTMMATRSESGFATIEGLSAPKVMMAPAPATSPSTSPTSPTTSTRSMTGTRTTSTSSAGATPTTSGAAPMMSGGATPSSAPAPMSGSTGAPQTVAAAEPVTMTLTNPFATPFRNVVATLHVNEAVVSTRQIGLLFPHQRRTVTFSEWSPPRPGTYSLRADLDGIGPTGNHLTSSASSSITIAGQAAAPRMAPMPDAPARSILPTRSFTPLIATASSQPVRGFGGATRGLGFGGAVRSLSAGSVLGLSANSILLRPFPPAAGTPVAITVQLSNLARVPARGARVAVSIDGEPLGETVTDVPASGMTVAGGFRDWSAKPGRHDVRASVTIASDHAEAIKPIIVTGNGGRGFERPGFVAGAGLGKPGFGKPAGPPGQAGKGSGGFQPGFKPMFPTGRPAGPAGAAGASGAAVDLSISTTDIHFLPAMPVPGAALTVTMTVHNLGTTPVGDGQVLAVLTAAGVEVARKQFTASVPAMGMAALEWPLTAPATTPIMVTVTATSAADANAANNQARATAAGKRVIKMMPRATTGAPR